MLNTRMLNAIKRRQRYINRGSKFLFRNQPFVCAFPHDPAYDQLLDGYIGCVYQALATIYLNGDYIDVLYQIWFRRYLCVWAKCSQLYSDGVCVGLKVSQP